MDVKNLEKVISSEKMIRGRRDSQSSSGGVYHIPLGNKTTENNAYCTKDACTIAKWALCFIPWFALLIIFSYLVVHYNILHQYSDKCSETLQDKAMNETINKAQIGGLKQMGEELKHDVKHLNETLIETERKYKIASDNLYKLNQTNIALNKDIRELKKKYQFVQDKYDNAQDKIDLYIKTIDELKKTLNVKISSDFLSSSASNVFGNGFVMMALGALLFGYHVKFD